MTEPLSTSLQVVQQAYAAFGKGDIPGVLTLLAPDTAWSFPDARGLWFEGTHTGPEQVAARVFAGIGQHMREFRIEPSSFVEVGGHVAVTGEVHATTNAGRELQASYFQVWQVAQGKARSVVEYHDRDRWLAALA
jgi:uncharacterized protein